MRQGRPDGAAEAQSALQSMMARTKITVEKREYGVIVYAENGISINLQMIESGWARNGLSTRDAEFKSFEDAQQNAVKMNRGIWGPNRLSTSTVAASPTVRSSGDISSSGPTLPEKRYGSDDGKFVAVVQARVTEVNSVWSRFSWRIVLTNNGTSAKSIVAMLEFQDKDGFALERTSSQRSTIAPGREEVLTEFELIDAAVAPRVAGVVGTIGEPR